jgi:phage tail-like protein
MKTITCTGVGLAALMIAFLVLPQTSAQATNFAVLLSGSTGDVILDDCDSLEIGDLIIDVIAETDPLTNKVIRKRPGKVKYCNLVLKTYKGTDASAELQDWWDGVVKGRSLRKTISVNLRLASGSPDGGSQVQYSFFDCLPEAFSTTEEQGADGKPVVVENYEVSTRGVNLQAGKAPPSTNPKIIVGTTDQNNVSTRQDDLTSWGGGEPAMIFSGPFASTRYHIPSERPFVTNLILTKEGAPGSQAMYDWINSVAAGKDWNRNVNVTEIKPNGKPGRTYTYHECWPCRWKAPELNSNSDGHLVESVEFVVERMK